ncbi:MAG: 50S ribosomal protein L24 [Dehalococcoidia bacterium]
MVSIRKGDTVIVLAGKDGGKRGVVQRVLPAEQRVVVEGVNLAKRHRKPNPRVRQAGIVEFEAPVHLSNVQLVCPKCNQPTRIGHPILQDGRRVRACQRCKAELE